MWIQVARDIFLEYTAAGNIGSRTLATFLREQLEKQGVVPYEQLSGRARTQAQRANQAFILDKRADMRGRLVQVAMAGKLKWSGAELAGFRQHR